MSHFRLTVVTLALLATACAGYGFADSVDDTGDAPTVYVEAIGAESHLGLDQSALRALLVDELQRQGLAVSGSPAEAVSLQCTVADASRAHFQHQLVAELTMSCAMVTADGDTTVRTDGSATGTIAPDADPSLGALRGDRQTTERAAADAISRIAPQLADAMN